MKFLLIALNAKYIHMNLALYNLNSYAGPLAEHIEIAEYTINQPIMDVLADICQRKPDVMGFSCYIWNWDIIRRLLPEVAKIMPFVPIWLGGPQVSYEGQAILTHLSSVTGIICGEGETTFQELLRHYLTGSNHSEYENLSQIKGIIYRQTDGQPAATEKRERIDMNEIPFPYTDLTLFRDRILYYESSRGCPYGCSYCLSAADRVVRHKDIQKVWKELTCFLQHKVSQVKFTDRTFNCDHAHALSIWQLIQEQDNGITNFHFEIAGDILTGEEIHLLKNMRPGLVQLEIGVQSTCEKTLDSVCRKSNFKKIRQAVAMLRENRNIHIHLDLIAGLPYEDYDTFSHSFNQVYACCPDQLQLGFLKVLPGTPLRRQSEAYGILYEEQPPWQVLFTRWISFEELQRLRRIEAMVELYYNSNQFVATLSVLVTVFSSPFRMFEQLSLFYEERGLFVYSPSRNYRYQILLDFACLHDPEKEACYKELLTFDLYLREKAKSRPAYAVDLSLYREPIRDFYQQEAAERTYLSHYMPCPAKQLAGITHMDVFHYPVYDAHRTGKVEQLEVPRFVLFDYHCRDALSRAATIYVID